MSCVTRYLSENYNHFLRLANRYVGPQYGGDLLNDLCAKYLDGNDKIEALCERNELGPYITRTLQICGFSQNSPFYRKYKKHHKKEVLDYPLAVLSAQPELEGAKQIQIEYQIEQVFTILQEIRWIDAEIFKAYYLHEHSLNSLADATGISKNTIYKAVKTAQSHCQENRQRIRGHGGAIDSGRSQEDSRGGSR